MEPPLGATHGVAREARQETQRQRDESVDGQDLTGCGGRQGYMDFFSEVFCVVSFFFFSSSSSSSLHFCTPRNTEMENIIKDWKKEQTLSVTFRNADSVKALDFFLSFFYFLRAALLNLDIREGNSPSLVSQISRGATRWTLSELRASLPCWQLIVFTILAVL